MSSNVIQKASSNQPYAAADLKIDQRMESPAAAGGRDQAAREGVRMGDALR